MSCAISLKFSYEMTELFRFHEGFSRLNGKEVLGEKTALLILLTANSIPFSRTIAYQLNGRSHPMPVTQIESVEALRRLQGQEVATSDWLLIDQARIQAFADATGDHQWIHVDVERARRESPFGAPVAHGYLTLSLLAKFAQDSIRPPQVRMGLNYGLNRVRFMSPVPAGSRIRARFTLQSIEDIPGGVQLTWQATIDIDGQDKPACVAEMLARWML